MIKRILKVIFLFCPLLVGWIFVVVNGKVTGRFPEQGEASLIIAVSLACLQLLFWLTAAIAKVALLIRKDTNNTFRKAAWLVGLAYCLAVVIFARLYLIAQEHAGYLGKFNQELEFLDALYFSLVTIATVGYGDIYPIGNVSRLFAGLEIICGLLFSVTLFSLLSSYLSKSPKNR